MLNVDEWLEGFNKLTPKNQIKIAKAIREKINYIIFTEEENGRELGNVLVEFFDSIADYIQDIGMLEKIRNILPRFYKLPKERQYNVLKQFVRYIEKQEKAEIEYQKKEECKNNGHDYSKWKETTYSTVEKNPYLGSRDYIVPEGMEYIYVEHRKWTRTCTRCGYVEETSQEPENVKTARIRREKDEEIKVLQKRIDELKKR